MKKILFSTLLVVCFTSCLLAQTVHPGYEDGKIWFKVKNDMPGLVRLPAGKSQLDLDQFAFLGSLRKGHQLSGLERPFVRAKRPTPLLQTFTLSFKDIKNVDKIIAELEAGGWIEYAEKVPLNKLAIIPNDYTSSAPHLNLINAPAAWDYSTGENAVIAIVDDAVDITHPDLAPNLWVNPGEIPGNGIDDDGNGYIDDIHGASVVFGTGNPAPPPGSPLRHGTKTASVAGAATNNGIGIASIGYNCKLMCISSSGGSFSHGYEGIVYAADNGANIISCSWGGPYRSNTAQNTINYARERGAVVVAGAGNDAGSFLFYPAGYEGVVAVAATYNNDRITNFSNYGNWITVCAPGYGINTAEVGGQYVPASGTSIATPVVSGLLGLMCSLNPTLPVDTLIAYLTASAVNIDALNPAYAGMLGAGRINAGAALQLVQATMGYLPAPDFAGNYTKANEGGSILFTGHSLYDYAPATYQWSFPGGTPSAYNGKTPPAIKYHTVGTYEVSLTVTTVNGQVTKTKNGYLTIHPYDPCNSIYYPVPGWDSINHGHGSIDGIYGWLYGISGRMYRQQAMLFDVSATPAAYITNVRVGFGRGYSADPAKIVPIHIFDGTSGRPGTLLGSSHTTMGQIMQDVRNKQGTIIKLNTPIAVPASNRFFVSVDYQQLKWDDCCLDTLSIYTAQDGLADPSPIWTMDRYGDWRQNGTHEAETLRSYLYIHPYLTNAPLVPAVQLSGSLYNVPGAPVTFTAVADQAGTNPVYEFIVNSTSKQKGSANTYTSHALVLGDLVSCKLFTNVECAVALSAVSNAVEVGANSSLPLTLLYFKGRITPAGNVLTWRTVSEFNTAHFIVERSSDGMHYEKAGMVKAVGESQAPVDYTFTDVQSGGRMVYYRLRMMDIDGRSTLSPVVKLEEKDLPVAQLKVWPQPVTAGRLINVKYTGNVQGPVMARITHTLGQVVRIQVLQGANGIYQAAINTSNLATGVYFIHCYNSKGDIIARSKLVVE